MYQMLMGLRYVRSSNAADRVCQIGFRLGRILPRPLSQMPGPTIEIFDYGQIELDKDNAPWHRHELFNFAIFDIHRIFTSSYRIF